MAEPHVKRDLQVHQKKGELSDLQLLVNPNPPKVYPPLTPLLVERDREEDLQDLFANMLSQREREDLVLLHEYSKSDLDLTQLVPTVLANLADAERTPFRTHGRFKPAELKNPVAAPDDDSAELVVFVFTDEDKQDDQAEQEEQDEQDEQYEQDDQDEQTQPQRSLPLRQACFGAARQLPSALVLEACRL